jgi:hypothetical protein
VLSLEIRLANTPSNEVTWTEQFTLPQPPQVWRNANKFGIMEAGKTSVTTKRQIPKDGWIENGWCVAVGDPVGRHVMKIYVQATLARTFEFLVE